MSRRQDNSEDLPSRDDFGPNLRPGCLYRTQNLLHDLRIGRELLATWRKLGLRPLIEKGAGAKADYWHSDDIIEFLRKQKRGGKP